MPEPILLGPGDEPQTPGAVVAVNWGDYRRQELWTASGNDIGTWIWPPSVAWCHVRGPGWSDVLARGPVVLLTAAPEDAYRAGQVAGRRELLAKIQEMGKEL
jgi:hypothetical protein